MSYRSAALRAFSLTFASLSVTTGQGYGRGGRDRTGRLHRDVPGPGRQPEPRLIDDPGLASVPRIARVSGHPADSPAVLESVLEPRRHPGVPAGAPARPAP